MIKPNIPPEHRKGYDAVTAKIAHRERLLALRDHLGGALLAGFVIDNVDTRTVPTPLFIPSDGERPRAAFIGFRAVQRLLSGAETAAAELGIGVSFVAMMLTAALITYQRHVVRRTESLAIGTDRLLRGSPQSTR